MPRLVRVLYVISAGELSSLQQKGMIYEIEKPASSRNTRFFSTGAFEILIPGGIVTLTEYCSEDIHKNVIRKF